MEIDQDFTKVVKFHFSFVRSVIRKRKTKGKGHRSMWKTLTEESKSYYKTSNKYMIEHNNGTRKRDDLHKVTHI